MGQKVKAGDHSFSAGEFNRHVDVSDYVHRHLMQHGGVTPTPDQRDRTCVTVRNNSGANRRVGELLEFNGLAVGLSDLTSNDLILSGGSPTLANSYGILLEPVAVSNGTQYCQISGACIGLVNVTDLNHGFAQVAAGSFVLQSAFAGPVQILWKPASTGERACGLKLGSPFHAFYRGITAATLTKGGAAGNVTRYKPGTTTSAGVTDTVKNELATVGSSKVVYYFDDGSGTLYLFAAECPLT
jgi:hypothetical protein